MIHILLADDHILLREGLKHLLDSYADMTVVVETDNGTHLMETVINMKGQIDVAIIDLNMPGQDALDVIQKLSNKHPEISTIVLTAHDEKDYALRSLKAGANSFISKRDNPQVIIDAIRKTATGGKYITESVAQVLADNIGGDSKSAKHTTLSNKEFIVFNLIASGHTTREIAEQLELSIRTINTFRQRILKKMDMKTNTQIVKYALENNLC